jgi:molybdate transport system regulatory protein
MAKGRSAELWIKVNLPGIGQIGPGKVELLRRIGEHASISAAARSMSMSYRRAWLLVEEMNGLFQEPVVATWIGGKTRGGAALTAFGVKLIASYDAMVQRSDRANRAALEELARSASRSREA